MKHRLVLAGIIITFIIVSLCSCATKVQIQRLKPAEVNLSQYKKVAVYSVDGQYGNQIYDELNQKLFESGKYEIIDRKHLDKIMAEHNFTSSGAIDSTKAVEIGKLIGPSALIFGRVNSAPYKERVYKYAEGKGQNGYYRDYAREGVASMDVTLQVTDLNTGKVVAIKKMKASYKDSTTKTNGTPDEIDKDELYTKCQHDIVNQFMKVLAPYYEPVSVMIEDNDSIPGMKTGITKLKMANYPDASSDFQQALQYAQGNPKYANDTKEMAKIYYNMGLACSYGGDYDNGIKYFEKANVLNAKDEYVLELNRCKQYKRDHARLVEQGTNPAQ